jgi:hypothetical protein
MNTGIIFLRSTASAFLLLEAWLARMRKELEKVAKLSATYVQWWTNDQTYFNEVLHLARTLSMNPKAPALADRAAWMEHMSAQNSGDEKRMALLRRVGGVIADEYGGRASGRLDSLRGVLCKELTCSDAKCSAPKLPLTIATFPYLQFASGHTYFTQSVQDRLGFTPVSVHTTFQFGDTPEFTWGKRNRLRERKLWVVDSDAYYARRGPGLHPKEVEYEGYVQLVGPLVDDRPPLIMTESSASIKIEGHGAFSETMRSNRVDVFSLDEGNPNKHLLLDSLQRRLVINLVALGRAMKRKVIMPKMMCWCDRYWWLLEGCRFPGVKPEVHPMPFHCPFDHLYDLEKWVHSDVPMREYSLLENERVSERDRRDVAHLHVHGASVQATPPIETTVTVLPGEDYAAAARALRAAGKQGAFVVQVHARSLELLCESLGSANANREFNQIIHTVLGVAEQVCARPLHLLSATSAQTLTPPRPLSRRSGIATGRRIRGLMPRAGRTTPQSSRSTARGASIRRHRCLRAPARCASTRWRRSLPADAGKLIALGRAMVRHQTASETTNAQPFGPPRIAFAICTETTPELVIYLCMHTAYSVCIVRMPAPAL